MKTETIVAICSMLRENYDTAKADYIKLAEDLRKKYGCRFNASLNEQEKKMWDEVKNKKYNCLNLLEDFNDHDWT